jgi:hypothetical protein
MVDPKSPRVSSSSFSAHCICYFSVLFRLQFSIVCAYISLPLIISSWLYCAIVLIPHDHLDGVTVAKAITLKDKFENLGARYGLLFSCDAYINFFAG